MNRYWLWDRPLHRDWLPWTSLALIFLGLRGLQSSHPAPVDWALALGLYVVLFGLIPGWTRRAWRS